MSYIVKLTVSIGAPTMAEAVRRLEMAIEGDKTKVNVVVLSLDSVKEEK